MKVKVGQIWEFYFPNKGRRRCGPINSKKEVLQLTSPVTVLEIVAWDEHGDCLGEILRDDNDYFKDADRDDTGRLIITPGGDDSFIAAIGTYLFLLLDASDLTGLYCGQCGKYNDYAQINQKDGSYKCWACRNGF